MATKAKTEAAANPGTGEGGPQGEAVPKKPDRPRKTAAARVATKTARAAKRQAKKSGKAVAGADAAAAKKPAAASATRTTSAAKRKATTAAKKEGILSRSIGKVRSVFSGAASSLSSLVRPKRKG